MELFRSPVAAAQIQESILGSTQIRLLPAAHGNLPGRALFQTEKDDPFIWQGENSGEQGAAHSGQHHPVFAHIADGIKEDIWGKAGLRKKPFGQLVHGGGLGNADKGVTGKFLQVNVRRILRPGAS